MEKSPSSIKFLKICIYIVITAFVLFLSFTRPVKEYSIQDFMTILRFSHIQIMPTWWKEQIKKLKTTI